MKATQKQIALLKKLHRHYCDESVDLSALDIKHASKLISTLIEMRKAGWNIKRQIYLSDVFYDIEEEAFGKYVTPQPRVGKAPPTTPREPQQCGSLPVCMERKKCREVERTPTATANKC